MSDFSKHGINYQFIDNFRVSQRGIWNRTEDIVVKDRCDPFSHLKTEDFQLSRLRMHGKWIYLTELSKHAVTSSSDETNYS